jgi:hypothetical protein
MSSTEISRLFIWLPGTITHFTHYLNDNSGKGDRIRYINKIFNEGITVFTKNLENDNIGKLILEFNKPKELDEWIISGLTKKEQDELFNSESEDDINDSP